MSKAFYMKVTGGKITCNSFVRFLLTVAGIAKWEWFGQLIYSNFTEEGKRFLAMRRQGDAVTRKIMTIIRQDKHLTNLQRNYADAVGVDEFGVQEWWMLFEVFSPDQIRNLYCTFFRCVTTSGYMRFRTANLEIVDRILKSSNVIGVEVSVDDHETTKRVAVQTLAACFWSFEYVQSKMEEGDVIRKIYDIVNGPEVQEVIEN